MKQLLLIALASTTFSTYAMDRAAAGIVVSMTGATYLVGIWTGLRTSVPVIEFRNETVYMSGTKEITKYSIMPSVGTRYQVISPRNTVIHETKYGFWLNQDIATTSLPDKIGCSVLPALLVGAGVYLLKRR